MQLTSSAFQAGGAIPVKYTGDGDDLSPPLAWHSPPEGTQSLALICDDPDAPRGTWVHWVLFDLPGGTVGLPEGIPTLGSLSHGGVQGKNDFGNLGYGGPAPPRGKPHRYFFRLYALDAVLGLAPGASRKEVDQAMHGHVLASSELMGTYSR